MLTTSSLTIGYRRRPIASNLDLELRSAEMVCLIGPNGAGKSTLLRTLAGMQEPLSGTVRLGDADLSSIPALELAKQLAVVLTGRVEAGNLSAYALVTLGRHPYTDWLGRLTPRDEEAVRRAMQLTGCEALAARPIHELSDGERQKVMIARALAQILPSPFGRGAGGDGLPSPFGRGAGGEGLPSLLGRGAGGEGLPSPFGRGAGGEGLPSLLGRGAGGEGLPSLLGRGAGSEGLPSPFGRGAGGEGLPSPALGEGAGVRDTVLLLDEPTAFLDLPRRVELLQLLKRLSRETRCAVLLSTHDLDLALRIADKLWLLSSHGELHIGLPEELALNGALARVFQSEGVEFDHARGAFKVHQPVCGPISLHGDRDGVATAWTWRALERIGYEVHNNGVRYPAHVDVLDSHHWRLTTPQGQSDHPTLASLLAALTVPSGNEPWLG